MIYDVSPFASETYRWSSRGGAAVTIDSPAEGRTAMRCNFPYESGEMIDLSLTMEAMGETLQVEYRCPVGAYDSGDWEEVCDYTGTNALPVGVSVSASPSVVFFDAGAATGLAANVACHYCVREAGTLMLHIADGSNCTVRNADGATVADGYTWSAGEDTRGARFFMVTGNWESNTPSGTVFRVTYTPEAGEDTASDEVSVTFVEVTTVADADCPTNKFRKMLGVCEKAKITLQPELSNVGLSLNNAGLALAHGALGWEYEAPDHAATEWISTTTGERLFAFTVLEPTGYEAHLTTISNCTQTAGEAGDFAMILTLKLLPDVVSFDGIEIMEKETVSTDARGYFSEPTHTNLLFHQKEQGRGLGLTWRKTIAVASTPPVCLGCLHRGMAADI